jgi:hypothetical protein
MGTTNTPTTERTTVKTYAVSFQKPKERNGRLLARTTYEAEQESEAVHKIFGHKHAERRRDLDDQRGHAWVDSLVLVWVKELKPELQRRPPREEKLFDSSDLYTGE